MSEVAGEVRFSLKLLINKEKTKVLFALVDSTFADILLSFLTVPLGAIVRLLKSHYGERAPDIGCLNSLYNGVQNLESDCFWTEVGKQMLLDPRSPRRDEYQKLKLNLFDTRPAKYFTCPCVHTTITIDYDSLICPFCENLMNRELEVRGSTENDAEVFTKQEVSFLLADDLRMVPNMTGSIMETFNNLNVTDVDGAEFHSVTVGFSEIMDLLKGSLFSLTPLTDIFLPESPARRKSELESSLLQMRTEKITFRPKNMKIKATIQKSSNRFLFAQAEEDFADFLLGFLAIPLGQVEGLLSMKALLASIDNFYQSVATFHDKCLKAYGTKNILLKPNLYFRSRYPFFSLSPERPPELFYHKNQMNSIDYLSKSDDESCENYLYWDFVDPRVKDSVKGSTLFMVTDDLTVTPLCLVSSLSLIKGLEVPLSDIVEVEINIGPEQALSILRASLTSSSSDLTDALMLNPGASWKLMRLL